MTSSTLSISEQKQQANELRKSEKYDKALLIYENLWSETGDAFDGAGLLHCLRKLEIYDKAIPFADELIVKYPTFEWCKKEIIWTYVNGILDKLKDDEPIENILDVAQKVISLNPDGLAAKKVVFKVLKAAKTSGKWEIVDDWVIRLNPDVLSTNPMINSLGREGWSDQSLWYNYRIKSLIEQDKINNALDVIDEIIERFPNQKKFFLRLKALAYYKQNNLSESEIIYRNLCNSSKPDWWLLHEYAKVIRDKGLNEEALKLMYRAISNQPKLEATVTLLLDIGNLCKSIGKNEEARAHYSLCKYVREERHWSIPDTINKAIEHFNKVVENSNEPSSLKEALSSCRNEWKKVLGETYLPQKKQKPRRQLSGTISFGSADRPFCFIRGKDNESFFCHKSDLPQGINDGDKVVFNAVQSFDKKKNKESWKAVDIRKIG